MSAGASADAIAAATPAARDRYVDFLRVAALGGVILGHFVMAVVVWSPGSAVSFTNILAIEPWTRWGTLLLQVMPVFFAVGGFAHAVAWRSTTRRGGGYADFAAARIGRLVRPALVYVGTWMMLGLVIDLVWRDAMGPVLQILGQLLWFIGIYLIAAGLAPLTLRAHERWGARALVSLVALAAAVDLLRLAAGVDGVKWLNFAFVWLAIHQLGYFYADGTVDRYGARRVGWAMLGGGTAGLVALAVLGPYGVSMVSYDGETLSNLAPPTVGLLAFGVAQAGAVLLLRERATRWLARPGVWRAVVVGGSVAMTAFLWHFTALVAVNGAYWWLGPATSPVGGSPGWWWLKVAMLVPFLALVLILVVAFRRFDRPPARSQVAGPSTWRAAVAGLGVASAVVGMIGFAAVGFRGVVELTVVRVVGVPMTAVSAALFVAASAVFTAVAARPDRTTAEAPRALA